MALLGKGGTANHYYPDDDPVIDPSDELKWSASIHNHFGETRYIALRMKLLNSTMLSPNTTSATPASAPIFYEVKHILLNNETWTYPIIWSLDGVERRENVTYIDKMKINGELYRVEQRDSSGIFRIVVELWVYNENSEEFVFSWESWEGKRCAWNQIWFYATNN